MPPVQTPHPMLVGQPPLVGELEVPAGAGALLVLVHLGRADGRQGGHRFIADVLRANGFATLSLCLQRPAEEAGQRPAPALAELAERLRGLPVWLARHGPRGLPLVGLVGCGSAVPACIAAASPPGLIGLRAMVLCAGSAVPDTTAVAPVPVPTLLIAGHRPAAALLAPHRLRRLRSPSAPGAYEAIACEATAWLLRAAAGGAGHAAWHPGSASARAEA